jgi:hypothetical protein
VPNRSRDGKLVSAYGRGIGRWRRVRLIPRIWTARSTIAPERRHTLLEGCGPATVGSISPLAAAAVIGTPRIYHHCRARLDAHYKRKQDQYDETCCFENSYECLLAPCFSGLFGCQHFQLRERCSSTPLRLFRPARPRSWTCRFGPRVGRLSAKRAIRKWIAQVFSPQSPSSPLA